MVTRSFSGCGKNLKGEYDIVYYPTSRPPHYTTWRNFGGVNDNFPHDERCGIVGRFCLQCATEAGLLW